MKDAFAGLNSYEKSMFIVLLLYAAFINFSVAVIGICYGAGILIMLVQYFKEKELPAIDKKLIYLVVGYNIVWLVLSLFSLDVNVSLKAWGGIAYRFMPLFFGAMYIKNLNQIKYIMLIFCLTIFIEDATAYYQALNFPSAHGNRATGCTDNPNDFANLLVLFIPALFFMAKQQWQDRWVSVVFMAGCICSVAALFLTQTRGAWLSLCVMVLISALIAKEYRRQIFKIIAVGLTGIVLMFAMSASFYARVNSIFDPNNSSNKERIMIYESSINMIKDYPVAGVGLDNFKPVYNEIYVNPESRLGPRFNKVTIHPHNNFLMIATEGGLIGFLAYVVLYASLLYLLYKKLKDGDMKDNLALMGIFVCLGLHLEGLTEMNINNIQPMRELWFLLGIALADLRREKNVRLDYIQDN